MKEKSELIQKYRRKQIYNLLILLCIPTATELLIYSEIKGIGMIIFGAIYIFNYSQRCCVLNVAIL
jgi:preprotein translocase subunit Sss1